MKAQKDTTDPVLERKLRPQRLKDYVGQSKVKKALQLFMDAGKQRGQVTEHLLFYGPPGMGKTTLAHILAAELGGDLKITSGPALEKAGDLAAILSNLKDNDVLFIDEIHRLRKPVEEALYPVMEEYALDLIVGKGPSARTMRLSIPRIVIIGATTRVALLSAPFRDRFGMVLRLDYYTGPDMTEIIMRSAEILSLPLTEDVAKEIAHRSRNTPRVANRILKRVRDIYELQSIPHITTKLLDELFDILEIDAEGLSKLDSRYLETLIEKFEGGPAGLSTLATALSEDPQTVEDFVEPYLIQLGYIKKTSKGRVATEIGYAHHKRIA